MRKEINHQNKMQEREIYKNARQRGLESHPQGVQRLPDLSMLEGRTWEQYLILYYSKISHLYVKKTALFKYNIREHAFPIYLPIDVINMSTLAI